jgi:hypothetical protein
MKGTMILAAIVFSIVALGLSLLYVFGNNNATEPVLEVLHSGAVVIRNTENANFREAMVDEIKTARSMRNEITRFERNRSADFAEEVVNYSGSRIAEIERFYFPTVEIPGFELLHARITSSVFAFSYVTLNPNDRVYGTDGEFIPSVNPQVRIGIYRICSFSPTPAKIFDEIAQSYNDVVFVDDNTIYFEISNMLNVLANNMLVSITVPDSLHCLDFMRDLALRVIETAELVTVR